MILKIFHLLILITTIATSTTINYHFDSPQSYDILNYTTTTDHPYIHVDMALSQMQTSVVAIIKADDKYIPSTNPQDWIHIRPQLHTEFDYQGMVTARRQRAWIKSPGVNQEVYIYLVNFERKITPNLTLTISEPSTIPDKCSMEIYHPSSFCCQQCPPAFTGCYCNITNSVLIPDENRPVQIPSTKYTRFLLQTQQNANVSIRTTHGGVSVYFQYVNESDQKAGLVNYVHDEDVIGHYHFVDGDRKHFELKNGNRSVALGVVNSNDSTIAVWVRFEEQDSILWIIPFVAMMIVILLVVAKFVQILMRKEKMPERRQKRGFKINEDKTFILNLVQHAE